MAYQQPTYGPPPPGQYPPQGYPPQYPPQQQPPYGGAPPGPYGAPPPQGYQSATPGYPPPQPFSPNSQYPQQYGASPQPGYGAASSYQSQPSPYSPPSSQPGYPQYGTPASQQYGAPPPQSYGSPPPPQYGGAPTQQYQQPGYQQPYIQAAPPSLGYGAPQLIQWNAGPDADALRKAMKGFGTDERTLINVLAGKDPLQMSLLRSTYRDHHKRDLLGDVQSETSGDLEDTLSALIRGPLEQDCHLLYVAMEGPGTKEKVLNDVLLGRSNADIIAIKGFFHSKYHQTLESFVKGDLSGKTERHFLMVLSAKRNEEATPVIPQEMAQEAEKLYRATEGKMGTDELTVCEILTHKSDAQIRAIAIEYQNKYTRDLETVIKKEFSGHMEDALIYQLRTGTDKAMRDATLLEDTMAGVGTKETLLLNRVVRIHWDRNHMAQVKGAYQHKYRTSLASRIKGEARGDFEHVLLAILGD